MFDALFKFDRVRFAEGEVGFGVGAEVWGFLALVAALALVLAIIYWRTNRYATPRQKAVSLGLRGGALALLCLPLFEPVLIIPDVVPDENFVAVLVDDSRSMTIPDGTHGARRDDVRHVLFESGLVDELGETFKVRTYAFADAARRADSLASTLQGPADGDDTNLSAALARALDDFRGLPLAGVVLLTDGADTSTDVPLNQAEELRARGVPLHVVGVGQEAFERERELLDVTVSDGVEATTGAEVDVRVRSWGPEPEPVALNLYRGDALVFTERRTLKGDGKIDQLTFFYEPDVPGAAEYRVEVAEATGEINTANNRLPALIDTRRDTMRVLYFEGHLRRDFKFIKRSLEDDPVVEFTSIARTGTGKYYRQGLRTPDELAGGFPNSEEELFAYKAVLFGDIEASAFSPDQLAQIERFVRVRGGGFAMLGGRTSFTEGDYWNTPVADVLPVTLDLARKQVLPPDYTDPEQPPAEQGFRFRPTDDGLRSPILKLSADPGVNQSRWNELPGLTSLNLLGAVKPGARVLAEKPNDDFGDREPLLVAQRYGKGRSVALPTASTWRWQLLVPADDGRHERFWRQLVRWAAADAPNRVQLDVSAPRLAPGDELTLTARAFLPTYIPLEGATATATLRDPFGTLRTLEVPEDLTEPGIYTTTLALQDEGVYEVEVAVVDADGEAVGQHAKSVLVRPSNREFTNATLQRTALEALADEAGGAYHAVAEADRIPDELRTRRTSTSIYRASYLWDMPLLFLLAVGLLVGEWAYRRRRGLP